MPKGMLGRNFNQTKFEAVGILDPHFVEPPCHPSGRFLHRDTGLAQPTLLGGQVGHLEP